MANAIPSGPGRKVPERKQGAQSAPTHNEGDTFFKNASGQCVRRRVMANGMIAEANVFESDVPPGALE